MQFKHIGIAIDSLAGGGAEKVVMTLARTLLLEGHRVTLLVLQKYCAYEIPKSLPVHFCFEADVKLNTLWGVRQQTQKIKSWIEDVAQQEGAFDLVLSNLDKTNFFLTRISLPRLYCIVHNSIKHELSRQKLLGPWSYLSLRRAKQALQHQRLVAVSQGVAQEVAQLSWLKPQSVQTIYNPYCFEEILDLADASCSELPKVPYMIHVGRMARQKRHDVLFQALQKTRSQMKLVLLCDNVKKAKKLAEKYGVADRLICPGFQQNPYAWMKHAKLLILSSDYEGFGSVLVEAMALNTPVVSTECEHGPAEILDQALAEWLVPIRSPQLLANKIDQALNVQPEMRCAPILKKIEASSVAKQYLALASD